ncbi:MAG: hypothetical protein VB137_10095 [Burkholderia sp.]
MESTAARRGHGRIRIDSVAIDRLLCFFVERLRIACSDLVPVQLAQPDCTNLRVSFAAAQLRPYRHLL